MSALLKSRSFELITFVLSPWISSVKWSSDHTCACSVLAHDGSMRMKQLLERQSHGRQPRDNSTGGVSRQFLPHCSQLERSGYGVRPPSPPCAVPWARQLALLLALLLAQKQQQYPQGVSDCSNCHRHVFIGGVACAVPHQQCPSTWRGSNTGLSSSGRHIWLLVSFLFCPWGPLRSFLLGHITLISS